MRHKTIVKHLAGDSIIGLDYHNPTKEMQVIFMPTLEEALAVDGCFVDKYDATNKLRTLSIQQFLRLITQGDLKQIQFVLNNENKAIISSPWWSRIRKDLLGLINQQWTHNVKKYALEQLLKFEPIKASNTINQIILEINKLTPQQLALPFSSHCSFISDEATFQNIKINHYINELGEWMALFGSHSYLFSTTTRVLRDKLRAVEQKINKRTSLSEKQDPKESDLTDFYRAFCYLDQVVNVLQNKPTQLPYKDLDYFNDISRRKVTLDEAHQVLLDLYNYVEQLGKDSWLPDTSKEIDKLYGALIKDYFKLSKKDS